MDASETPLVRRFHTPVPYLLSLFIVLSSTLPHAMPAIHAVQATGSSLSHASPAAPLASARWQHLKQQARDMA